MRSVAVIIKKFDYKIHDNSNSANISSASVTSFLSYASWQYPWASVLFIVLLQWFANNSDWSL